MNFFAPLIGQPQAVELLNQAIIQNRIAPAYLFAGVEGIGRNLAARCFIEQLFCQHLPKAEQTPIQNRLRQGTHPDVLWIQPTYLYQGQRYSAAEATEKKLKRKAPPIIRTEQIREIAQFLSRRSAIASRSIVVIEKAETMAESAANALLKTLEEPGQATLILIAPSTESLLPTLGSRCQKIPFYRLNFTALSQVLRQSGQESILSAYPAILATCQGSPGNAIYAVQICQAIPPELIHSLEQLPRSSLRNTLELARQVGALELEAQLWLLDYLQQQYWQQFLAGKISPPPLAQLEKARKYLLSFVQPRLVWEVALIELSAIS
ncbi:DNA polymerase III subunit delta' [Synechocystis sp. PCC 7509]|uniref:DNA polymerase III subunit delta' n=1 Tax=Synechocystis sp. PCC 7509 TaxID=927677 RepID=UPI0002AC1604|nr:DNA polymerase III subunit delta' [Synechocystis sp. PCC 7509]